MNISCASPVSFAAPSPTANTHGVSARAVTAVHVPLPAALEAFESVSSDSITQAHANHGTRAFGLSSNVSENPNSTPPEYSTIIAANSPSRALSFIGELLSQSLGVSSEWSCMTETM